MRIFSQSSIHGQLRNAANNGEIEKVEASLQAGADINTVNKHGNTALYLAVKQGNLLVVKFLLKQGANPSIPDIYCCTPLQIAVDLGRTQIVKVLLIEAGVEQVDINRSFWRAVALCKPELVEILVEHGADINTRNRHGDTALNMAKESCIGTIPKYRTHYEKIVEILEGKGALLR